MLAKMAAVSSALAGFVRCTLKPAARRTLAILLRAPPRQRDQHDIA